MGAEQENTSVKLSGVEQEALNYLVQGKSQKEMAADLRIPEATARTRVRYLREAVGAANAREAMASALDGSLVDKDEVKDDFDISTITKLTPKEWEVYKRSVQNPDFTTKENAFNIGRSGSRFRQHLVPIFRTTGTTSQEELLLFDYSLRRARDFHFEGFEYESDIEGRFYNPLEDQVLDEGWQEHLKDPSVQG